MYVSSTLWYNLNIQVINMTKLAQIHFDIPLKQKEIIHQLAKNDGMNDSDFYRQIINHEIISQKANLASQKLIKNIQNDQAPRIHNEKELQAWLKK